MKLLIYTDNHFSQYSSILRKRGEKYSLRLENQIQSLNWVQQLATLHNCSAVYNLGDFFDASSLNAEELTALKEIVWAKVPQYFLVGNHELGTSSGIYTSAHLLNIIPNITIINQPCTFCCGDATTGADLLCIPYMTDKKELTVYTSQLHKQKKLIILSHNDIKGIQYGPYLSTEGFDIGDIKKECNMFINGHLHNHTQFCPNGWNLGNLTGQNFGEDAFVYKHFAAIVDTDTLNIEFIENPFALNFYKLDCAFDDLKSIESKLQTLQSNAVVTVKASESNIDQVRELLAKYPNILEYRVLLQPTVSTADKECIEEIVSVDHREQFKQFVLDKLGSSELVVSELSAICEG